MYFFFKVIPVQVKVEEMETPIESTHRPQLNSLRAVKQEGPRLDQPRQEEDVSLKGNLRTETTVESEKKKIESGFEEWEQLG